MFRISGILRRLIKGPTERLSSELREHLSQEQYRAVTAPIGPTLVVAGPGSGKTRTLVYRVLWMVLQGIPPNLIVVLTFTRKAAQEAKERLRTFLGPEVIDEIFIGTFHSFGLRLLREAGVNAKILPPEEAASLWRKAGGTEADLQKWGFYEGKGWSPPKELVPVIERYQRLKGERLDFRDLIQKVRGANPVHFLVDEFQDTDQSQLSLIKKMALSVFAVGDPNQAIYSWRGGDQTVINNFTDHFPGGHICSLRENWRSARRIVEVANRIVSLIPFGGGTTMIPAQKEEGEVLVRAASMATDVARFIEAEVGQALHKRESFALLLRSNREVSEWSQHLEALGLKSGGPSVAKEIMAGLMELVLFEDMRGVSRLQQIEAIPESFKRALLNARGPYHLWERGEPGVLRLLQGLHALQRIKRGRSTFLNERGALRRALSFDPATADSVLNFIEFTVGDSTGERALEEALHLLAEESSDSFHSSVLTYHKSKGLEWDRVVVVLPPGDKRLSPGELMATFVAFTRARKRLVVIGQGTIPPPLHKAIGR